MKTGTKSVLFGAHCFLLHPWFVAWAWWKLYGFPWDPRLWVAFFVHDLGYIGKSNMDGPEGETHPEFGAQIMSAFDTGHKWEILHGGLSASGVPGAWVWKCGKCGLKSAECVRSFLPAYRTCSLWHDFCLFHSRYYAKRLGMPFSRLCVADKLSFALTPRWLYLPMVNWTGEIHEYLKMAKNADTATGHFNVADYRGRQVEWHTELCRYMREWVKTHRNGAEDTWTSTDRHEA